MAQTAPTFLALTQTRRLGRFLSRTFRECIQSFTLRAFGTFPKQKPGLFRDRALLGWIRFRDPISPPKLYAATNLPWLTSNHPCTATRGNVVVGPAVRHIEVRGDNARRQGRPSGSHEDFQIMAGRFRLMVTKIETKQEIAPALTRELNVGLGLESLLGVQTHLGGQHILRSKSTLLKQVTNRHGSNCLLCLRIVTKLEAFSIENT